MSSGGSLRNVCHPVECPSGQRQRGILEIDWYTIEVPLIPLTLRCGSCDEVMEANTVDHMGKQSQICGALKKGEKRCKYG